MVDTGSFDSLPSIPHFIDGIQPLLDDDESTTSPAFFTRVRDALFKKLDHDQEKSAADKAEKKKRKETHSVTVCVSSTEHILLLTITPESCSSMARYLSPALC
jgi:hypothetical protein